MFSLNCYDLSILKQSALVVLFASLPLKETWSKLSSQPEYCRFHCSSPFYSSAQTFGRLFCRYSLQTRLVSSIISISYHWCDQRKLRDCSQLSYFRSSLIQSGSAVRNLSNSSFETLALARLCSEQGFVLKTISLSLKPR